LPMFSLNKHRAAGGPGRLWQSSCHLRRLALGETQRWHTEHMAKETPPVSCWFATLQRASDGQNCQGTDQTPLSTSGAPCSPGRHVLPRHQTAGRQARGGRGLVGRRGPVQGPVTRDAHGACFSLITAIMPVSNGNAEKKRWHGPTSTRMGQRAGPALGDKKKSRSHDNGRAVGDGRPSFALPRPECIHGSEPESPWSVRLRNQVPKRHQPRPKFGSKSRPRPHLEASSDGPGTN
jgi:hypothetical protein